MSVDIDLDERSQSSNRKQSKFSKNQGGTLTAFYFDELGKDRTEGGILAELDSGGVDVKGDVIEEEPDTTSSPKASSSPKKQTSDNGNVSKNLRYSEAGKRMAVVFFRKTTWSLSFVNLVHYCIFLFLFLSITLGRTTPLKFFTQEGLRDTFVDNEFEANGDFRTLTTKAGVWKWVEDILVPNLYPEYDFTGGETMIFQNGGHRLSDIKVRTLRVQTGTCVPPSRFETTLDEDRCYERFSTGVESVTPWDIEESGDLSKYLLWESGDEEGTVSYYSPLTKTRYPASGYTRILSNDMSAWDDLKDDLFLDLSTRVVFFDFVVYNPQVNYLTWATFVVEIMATGDVLTSYRLRHYDEVASLQYINGETSDGWQMYLVVCEILLMWYVFTYILVEMKEVYFYGRSVYFGSLLNIMEIFNLLIFCVAFAMRILSIVELNKIYPSLMFGYPSTGEVDDTAAAGDTDIGGGFPDLTTFSEYSYFGTNLIALNSVFTLMRFFKFASFHRGLAQFIDTFGEAGKDLTLYLLVMFVLVASYGLSFHVAFGHVSQSYYDVPESLFSLFGSTLGQFDLKEIQHVNRYLAPFLFVSFIVVMLFVVLSMLVAMVKLSYHSVREEDSNNSHKTEHEIIDDLVRVFMFGYSVVSKIPVVGAGLHITEGSRERFKLALVSFLDGESSKLRAADSAESPFLSPLRRALSSRERGRGENDDFEGSDGLEEFEGLFQGAEEEEEEILVKQPRLDLLKELVEIENVQKSVLLTGIEDLSKLARAAAFDRLNKQIEDIVTSAQKAQN